MGMKRVFAGLVALICVLVVICAWVFHQRANVAIESVEAQLLAKGAGNVEVNSKTVTFDWMDILVCGKVRVENVVSIRQVPSKTIYFEYFLGDEATLFPGNSTGRDPTICQMNHPWWWINW
jgi:hypothetical protein